MTDATVPGFSVDVDRLGSLFESLKNLPRTDRGRKNAMRATCPPKAMESAAAFVDAVGLDALIENWLCADRPNRALRLGRPESISPRTYLVAAFACSFAALPVSLIQIHHVITDAGLDAHSRRHLGLPVSEDPIEDARFDRSRRRLTYPSLARMSDKIAATFDPRPYPSHRGLTEEETDAIDAVRDWDDSAMRQKRADRLQATLFAATFRMLPVRVRDQWHGDITFDETPTKTPGKRGHGQKRKNRGARSPEANAGWSTKQVDKRDLAAASNTAKAGSDQQEWQFGYGLHLGLIFTPGESQNVPPLILAASLDTPSRRPGQNAVAALTALREQGLPAGCLTADMGYSQVDPENYAFPVRALGYALMHMFKAHELGTIQATWKGLIVVEGTVYGPCLPTELRMCVKDFKEGRIDEATFEQRIETRRPYQARTKTGRDGKQSYVFRCPGCGVGRKVRCDLKPVDGAQEAREVGARKMLPLVLTVPQELPACCQSSTVSVPAKQFARYVTHLPYETKEWRAYYRSARNQMEGRNGFLKNPLGANIATPGERRFRGWAKQFFALLTKIIAANIDALLPWIDDEEDGLHQPKAKKRGRPVSPGLDDYLNGPNAPPVRIVGRPRKKSVA